MPSHHNSIESLLHLLSPNFALPRPPHKDYIFESPLIGFFRLAYSRKQHAIVVYFGRHPGDFEIGAKHGESIKSNNHIYPVRILPVPYRDGLRWNLNDSRRQHDVSWINEEIIRISRALPQILYRENNLHRLDENTFGSAYVGYGVMPKEDIPELASIKVATNRTPGFDPIALKIQPGLTRRNAAIRTFRAIGRQLMRRLPSTTFTLKLAEQKDNDHSTVLRDAFTSDETIPALKSDFVHRNALLWSGVDPIRWRENHFVPVIRLHARLRERVNEMRSLFAEDRRSAYVEVGKTAAHILLHHVFAFCGTFLLDRVLQSAVHEGPASVPRKWRSLIRDDHHFLSINPPYLRSILLQVKDKFYDDDHFGDIKWLHPAQDCLSLVPDRQCDTSPADNGFHTWFRGQFFAPYATLIEYLGSQGKLHGLHETDQVKAIRVNVPNGLQIYYLPESRTLYGYYHPSKLTLEKGSLNLPQQYLPPGYETRFKDGHVIKMDLANDHSMAAETVGFHEFESHIYGALGAKNHEEGKSFIHLLSSKDGPPPPDFDKLKPLPEDDHPPGSPPRAASAWDRLVPEMFPVL